MKKALLILSGVIALASCAKVNTLDSTVSQGKEGPIGFMMEQKNMVKSETALQKAGHNNFGVFAYKSTDQVNNIMSDYLVGYNDDAKAYSASGTTVGDADGVFDGKSLWMYEGLGHAEFTGTYAGERVNPGTQYASNVANQYLRYWDMAAAYTCFYAYAPYVNTTYRGATVTYVDGQPVGTSSDKNVMTIPNGTLRHGYDNADEYEFMYAWTKVEKASYGHDVALHFNRLNAKVNIKFWEDIAGYSVRIIDVAKPAYSISAVPSIKDGTSGKYGYRAGQIYTENGAKIQFFPEDGTTPLLHQYEGIHSGTTLNFAAPTAAQIGDTRLTATPSATTYYAIPKGSPNAVLANGAINIADPAGSLNADLALTGLTFHVSYELISTTGEVITVKDATVHVPVAYTNWAANTHYTYIFKITSNSNGTTDNTVDPKPTDPEVPTEPGLYPIVFDNCTVEDWDENESEHVISDELAKSYHNITLGTYSLVNGDVTVEIANGDNYLGHEVVYAAYSTPAAGGVEVSGPDAVNVTYDAANHKVVVASGAAAGLYTVTYHCPSADVYVNHPSTWTAQFIVGSAYVVNTNLPEVGTKGLAASALSISATQDGSDFTPTAAQLSIEYPVNIPTAVKNLVKISTDGSKVEVDPAAVPGTYKLVLKIDEGVGVKVAEKVFTVKNYQFALDHKTVYNSAAAATVVATAPAIALGSGVTYTYESDDFTVTDNTITVPVNTTEGDYTVTLVVNKDTASEVKYEATFKVQNQYTVALSKNTLNTTIGAANEAVYGTDFIDITSTTNGVADVLSAETAAKYTVEGIDAADYKIEFIDEIAAVGTLGDPDYVAAIPAHIKLQVKKTVAAGTYKVVYTGQSDKIVKAAFVIQK